MKKPTKPILIINNVDAESFIRKIEGAFEAKINELLQTRKEVDSKKLLTGRELQTLFDVSRNTLINYERRGLLRSVKIGRNKYYNLNEIEGLFDKKKGNK